MKSGDHLFLVDGSAYIFRAYHALPPLTRKSDGMPVGAVSGFCNMLWKLLTEARNTAAGVVPTHFAVIFDHSSKTFRNDIYPEYKANRDAPPEDLRPQFALIREATRAFGVPCIELEGFEADDIIATYVRQVEEIGGGATIISSDKDLMQLVSDNVILYDTMKDKRIGPNGVVEKFGVGPEKMIDLQALVGDTSDNVPGIPGIGPKTAAQLLDMFGDLDTLLERAGEIKQNKRRESIIEFADQARLSRELVTLRQDCVLPDGLDTLELHPVNGADIVAYLKGMGFNGLTKRVAEATDIDANAIDPSHIVVGDMPMRGPDLDAEDNKPETISGTPQAGAEAYAAKITSQKIDRDAYVTISDAATLKAWVAEAFNQGFIAVDLETTSLDPLQAELCGIALALSANKAAYVPVGHMTGEASGDMFSDGPLRADGQLTEDEALAILKPMLEAPSVMKIGQNFKYDYSVFAERNIKPEPLDDTMLISYALDAGFGSGHGMDALAEKWLGHTPIAFKEVAGSGRDKITFERVAIDQATTYAAEDADITLRLWQMLKPRLAAEGLTEVYERLERPLVPVLCRMEGRGIMADRQILSSLSSRFAQRAAGLEAEIHTLAGHEFNVGSPKQLGEILFGELGLPGGKKTKTGQWSTDAKVLDDLANEGHELPAKIVEWRQLTKLKGTYTDALPNYMDKSGRIHTSYAMASTSTGRLSSSDPNLQNIPIRTNEGREIRTAFVAPKGKKLISADYSQIELRVLAHVADIPQLKKAFAEGQDIHAMTASEMFGVPIEGMDPMIRRQAKAINFGIIYGISGFGLANQLGIGRSEASDYIKTYFERFPGIKDYMEETKKQAKDMGYVETLFGRRIHFDNINSSNAMVRQGAERAAINAPIQGAAADIIRRAMVRMEPALDAEKLSAMMLLQVHDELIFEVEESEVDATIPVICKTMQDASFPAVQLSVPLVVEAQAANNWDDAH